MTDESTSLVSAVRSLSVPHLRALLGDPRVVKAINAPDADGNPALHIAAVTGQSEMVTVLLGAGADVHKRDKNGWTALHCASITGFADTVKVLLDAKADVNSVESDTGGTPLMFAASGGNVDVVKLLLDAKAPVTAISSEGRSALHKACSVGAPKVVEALIAAGADPRLKSKWGESPLEVALKGLENVAPDDETKGQLYQEIISLQRQRFQEVISIMTKAEQREANMTRAIDSEASPGKAAPSGSMKNAIDEYHRSPNNDSVQGSNVRLPRRHVKNEGENISK